MGNTVEDELAIRELVSLYADAVNRVDEEQWADTWTENAEWSLPMATVEGKTQIVGLWVQAMSSFEFVAQLVYQGVVEIDGNKATGRWYLCLIPINFNNTLINQLGHTFKTRHCLNPQSDYLRLTFYRCHG
jgi:hypothetical protein